MKKIFALVLTAIMTVSVLSGCGKAGSGQSKKDTIVVATSSEPKSLDAHGPNDSDSTLLHHQIYDTLVKQKEDNTIAPGLAEKWEYKDDTTLTLHIRKGVKFHNGEALDASDIIYTIKRAHGSSFSNWIVSDVDLEKTKAIDENTVEIKLLKPSGAFLSQLCFLYVVDEKTVTEAGESYEEKPVGTGPFKFVQWHRGDRIEFETNKEYWGTVPEFDKLTMRFIAESSSRAMEIESGGVDAALRIAANDIEGLEADKNVTMIRSLGYGNTFVGFNCAKEPFNNKLLRQAISYALDKEAIVQAVYNGIGSVAEGPLSPSIWGYNPNLKGYKQNIEKAKELLAKAGYPNGLEITLTISDSQERVDIAEMIQNQLKQINVTVNVESMENATYLDKIINGEFQMYILGWSTNTGDADYGLYEPFYTGRPAWSNTARYSNKEVDKLLDLGRASTEEKVRLDAYYKAQELIVDDAPWVFLYNKEETAAINSNLEGLKSSPSGRYEFCEIKFKN